MWRNKLSYKLCLLVFILLFSYSNISNASVSEYYVYMNYSLNNITQQIPRLKDTGENPVEGQYCLQLVAHNPNNQGLVFERYWCISIKEYGKNMADGVEVESWEDMIEQRVDEKGQTKDKVNFRYALSNLSNAVNTERKYLGKPKGSIVINMLRALLSTEKEIDDGQNKHRIYRIHDYISTKDTTPEHIANIIYFLNPNLKLEQSDLSQIGNALKARIDNARVSKEYDKLINPLLQWINRQLIVEAMNTEEPDNETPSILNEKSIPNITSHTVIQNNTKPLPIISDNPTISEKDEEGSIFIVVLIILCITIVLFNAYLLLSMFGFFPTLRVIDNYSSRNNREKSKETKNQEGLVQLSSNNLRFTLMENKAQLNDLKDHYNKFSREVSEKVSLINKDITAIKNQQTSSDVDNNFIQQQIELLFAKRLEKTQIDKNAEKPSSKIESMEQQKQNLLTAIQLETIKQILQNLSLFSGHTWVQWLTLNPTIEKLTMLILEQEFKHLSFEDWEYFNLWIKNNTGDNLQFFYPIVGEKVDKKSMDVVAYIPHDEFNKKDLIDKYDQPGLQKGTEILMKAKVRLST